MTNYQNDDLNSQYHFPLQKTFPKVVLILFYLFAVYLVIPVIDVPLLGLSLSAPIFFFIAITCILKPPHPWFHEYRRWIILAVLIWVGIFISAMANGLNSGGINIDNSGILTIIRYTYWLLVFVVTVYFANQGGVLRKVTALLGWEVLVLALLRWGEVLIYGNIGIEMGPHLMSQNSYGFQFSTFSPFLLILMIQQRGWKRVLAAVGNVLLWGATLINGSRGSWAGVAAGIVLCLVLFAWAKPRRFLGVLVLLLCIGGLTVAILRGVPEFASAVESRFNTLLNLEDDKSYMIRQLMNQKSIQLFEQSPIIGVGTSRFTKSSSQLAIPALLSYGSQSFFNKKSAHNSYLSFLAENGLLGSFPYVLLLLFLGLGGVKYALRGIRKNEYWGVVIFSAFVAMSVHMWAISTLENTVNWFIYGLLGAVIMYGEQQSKSIKP
jgi:O-antigen ligase